ncbi:MAG: riboflavin synthase [Cellvibrionaceae bacterium]
MFTGIIEAMGTVTSLEHRGGDVRLQINSDDLGFSDVLIGDSIATNGVCLTAIELPEENASVVGYSADVSVETLDLTTVKHWQVGQRVNLEKALTPQTRLGGHLVSGHVDGLGEVLSVHQDARAYRFTIKAPDELAKYIAHKGSITVDGTSLTVNAVNGAEFELAIVPHTWDKTVISTYKVGTQVNLEVDLIARHLERLLLGDKAAEKIEK